MQSRINYSRAKWPARRRRSQGESGAMIFLVMVSMSVVLGIIAAGYMLLISSQHRLVSQSMNWNNALTLAEAGIEEGLSQLNIAFGTNYVGSAMTNWTFNGSGFGPVTRTFTNGSYSTVIQLNGGPCPSIIATGYAANYYDLPTVKRVVKVETTNFSPFVVALTAKYGVTTKGNNLTVDSYDSTDPLHSTTNGMYDPATRMAGGDIASIYGPVQIQNAEIYGRLRTGPSATYDIGNGSVGDLTWNVPGQIQPGWYENDYNSTPKDVDPPFTSGFTMSFGAFVAVAALSTNTYILNSGNYYHDADLTINNGEGIYVNGNATLYVTGTLNMKNATGTYITIAPGSSLKIYIGKSSGSDVSATFGLVNNNGNCSSFQVFGLPTLTSMVWGGNSVFIGTIYCPQAAFECGGGGSTVLDYQGACCVSSASLNGHFNFHYDQNLSRAKPGSGFIITAWREL